MRLVLADRALRARIQDATFPIWNEGLDRAAYGNWNEAQMRTAWGRDGLHRFALLDDDGRWVASLKRYRLPARLDGERVEMTGVGAVFTPPELRGGGFASRAIEELLRLEDAAGAALAGL